MDSLSLSLCSSASLRFKKASGNRLGGAFTEKCPFWASVDATASVLC